MEQNNYRRLEGLVGSDFQVKEGQPDIIGWDVKNESNNYIGEITDLLYDKESLAVRYLIIDLDDNDLNLNDKKVMIPIGIAHLHTSSDEVVLPNVHADQFNALPDYKDGQIGPNTEMYIRSVIGSPAALRMEEETAQFDQEEFYSHHHFNNESFYQRGGNPDRSNYNSNYRPGEHTIKPWLQPGASHNQGADNINDDQSDYDTDRRPSQS